MTRHDYRCGAVALGMVAAARGQAGNALDCVRREGLGVTYERRIRMAMRLLDGVVEELGADLDGEEIEEAYHA